MKNTIFNLLTKEYSLIHASTPHHFKIVQNLRKNIITTKYPEFKKSTEYSNYLFSADDKQSFIYLLRHNQSNIYIGSVRIYFINEATTSAVLPMATYIQDSTFDNMNIPICEISRFSLSDKLQTHTNLSALRLRTYLTLGLMVATRLNLFLYNYSQVFAIMEPSLHKILKRQGVDFKQIGEPIEYYGKRVPYKVDKDMLLRETEETMGKLTKYYLKKLCESPDAFWNFIDNNPYLERSDIQIDRICQLFQEHGDDVDISLLLGEEVATTS